MLYELLTGQQPFQGDNRLAISCGIQLDPPPVLTGDSSLLNGIVVRSLDDRAEYPPGRVWADPDRLARFKRVTQIKVERR